MAVTTEYSTEYNLDFQAPSLASMTINAIGLIALKFAFTQGAAAGDVASLQYLRRLPPGEVYFFPALSRIRWTAFGAARTLDIGYGAYTDPQAATPAVVADDNAFDDNVDVSAAGGAALGSDVGTLGTGGEYFKFVSKTGVPIFATVAGDTIPAAATLKGWLVIGKP